MSEKTFLEQARETVTGLTGIVGLEAEMRDRLAAKDRDIARLTAELENARTGEAQSDDLCMQYAGNFGSLLAKWEHQRKLLQECRHHVYASNQAEHMMDGFGPRSRQPSDGLLKQIDAALAVTDADTKPVQAGGE